MPARKELIVVAGPNGAGKTTFAREYLTEHPITYLSADAIAAELAPHDPTSARIAAGREFLRRLEAALLRDDSLMLESTLSGRGLKRKLDLARTKEFEITIAFVFLDSVDACIDRVRQRVRKGGHDVPETDIRRRFTRSFRNFWHAYRLLADHWVLAYNAGEQFELISTGSADGCTVQSDQFFAAFQDHLANDTNG